MVSAKSEMLVKTTINGVETTDADDDDLPF
jgi:hypothetical protein